MRRIVLVMLLAVMSGNAAADWIRAGSAESFTAYADATTLKRTGARARMWQLYDFRSAQSLPDDKQYLSTRSRYEHDCDQKQTRQLAVRAHVKNMGKGKIIDSISSIGEWNPIAPDTILESVWKIACQQR